MRNLFSIAWNTLIEIFRNKVFHALVLFAVVLIASTVLFSALGGEQRIRMIYDLGLASIEAFALITTIFASVSLVLEEMQSKTLYLILTRPINRWVYVAGRFLGLTMIIGGTIALMAALHVLVLLLHHWHFEASYLLALFFAWEKVVIVASVGIFFSLFSTSTLSAVTFTVFLWVLGHFSEELHYLSRKGGSPLVEGITTALTWIAPNFQWLNWRDMEAVPQLAGSWLIGAGVYGLVYSLVFLSLAILLFRRKEF